MSNFCGGPHIQLFVPISTCTFSFKGENILKFTGSKHKD